MVVDYIGSPGVGENTIELGFKEMASSIQIYVPEVTGMSSTGVSIGIPVNKLQLMQRVHALLFYLNLGQ
jgi:hypothetical protein